MKVYAVYEGYEHGQDPIFSTREKAEAYVGGNPSLFIQEKELDATDPPGHYFRKVYCAEMELLSAVDHGLNPKERFELLSPEEEIEEVDVQIERQWRDYVGGRYVQGRSTRSYEHALRLAEQHRKKMLMEQNEHDSALARA